MRRILGRTRARRSTRLLTTALAAATLLVGLAACGDDDADGAADDAATDPPTSQLADQPSESTEPSQPTDEPTMDTGFTYDVVALVNATAAGGTLDETLVPVAERADVRGFTRQFRMPDLRTDVTDAVARARSADATADADLYVATVAIGCDVPTDVVVTDSGGALQVQARKVADPLQECLAPVTTVAVVAVSR